MRSESRLILKNCATIAMLWLAGLGTAGAIVIRGVTDPTFDGSGVFNGDTWTAEIQFTDSDASCVSGANFNVPNPPGVVCVPDLGTLSITGTLSDGTNTATLDFLNVHPAPTISITTSNGVATAIQTGIVGASALFDLSGQQGFAWIDFEFGSTLELETPSVATISLQACPSFVPDAWVDDVTCTANLDNATTSSADSVTVTQTTPEPGMLWLVFGALSAVWLMRRRVH